MNVLGVTHVAGRTPVSEILDEAVAVIALVGAEGDTRSPGKIVHQLGDGIDFCGQDK